MAAASSDRGVPQVLAEFAQLVAGEHGIEEILQALGDFSTELLPVDGIGVLLAVDGNLRFATANTPEGAQLERLEADLGEGPCSTCAHTGQQVLVPDLGAAADRWPRFVPAALELGIRSVHALPMTVRADVVGALDITASRPVTLTQSQIDTAQMLADVAIAYIVNIRMRDESSRLAAQLQSALDHRVTIEQAKGKLAERHREPVDDAFERLRRFARENRLKLRHVAEQVVTEDLQL